jgi:hypothetical protein
MGDYMKSEIRLVIKSKLKGKIYTFGLVHFIFSELENITKCKEEYNEKIIDGFCKFLKS